MSDKFLTITNEDIYKELQHLKEVGQKTLEQACRTNGRVTKLEEKSIGVWISLHPFKFAGLTMIFFAFAISDIRQPVMLLVKGLFA